MSYTVWIEYLSLTFLNLPALIRFALLFIRIQRDAWPNLFYKTDNYKFTQEIEKKERKKTVPVFARTRQNPIYM